ncbi:hypothetical protein SLA2020_022490 [Shorea laevis]
MDNAQLQSSGMLSREQLLYLFDGFALLTSQSDVKKRIADAEAVAITTTIKKGIFLEMGINPRFGLAYLGSEEMACDEAELGPDELAERLHSQQKLQEQQLQMLKYLCKFHLDDQSAILEKLHQQMQEANFYKQGSVMSLEQIQEVVQRMVSPLFKPR